jgi:Domain of unknown function (DUF1996)
MNRRIHLRIALVLLGAVAAVAAAFAVAGGNAAGPALDITELEDVNFVVVCKFSHRAGDDPIVHPGSPGASHDHTFFGNVATDALSTPASLRSSATSCSRSGDTAAYWAPTLIANNKPVAAIDAKVYYRRRTIQRVRAFPPGLEMVAGDAGARSPQSMRTVYWDCGEQSHGRTLPSSAVQECPEGRNVMLHVRFPDCWNGTQLDAADHHSHMAYSERGRCPATHPVAVPSIDLLVRYPLRGTELIELASMGQLSGHADFVNAWQQPELERLVEQCLNALRRCGPAP